MVPPGGIKVVHPLVQPKAEGDASGESFLTLNNIWYLVPTHPLAQARQLGGYPWFLTLSHPQFPI